MKAAALLSLALLPFPAHAYIPPSFFVYAKLSEPREQAPNPSLVLTVSRPAQGGTEEALGSITLPSWGPEENGWPVLSLLFSSKPEELIAAVEKFGLAVPREQDLLRVNKEQAAAMKEPPNPFYKSDKSMGLKRHRQTYAWVHSGPEESKKSVWIEKDTFLPLKVVAPCPPKTADLPWAKSGEGLCEVEFRNIWSLRRGSSPAGAKIILLKDGNPMLQFSFEKIAYPKTGTIAPGAAEAKVPDEVREIALAILH